MPMYNFIEKHIPEAVIEQVDNLLGQLTSTLAPYLVDLNEEENLKYGSISEQNKLIVNKVYDYYKTQPQLSAPEVDWREFEADMKDRRFLETRMAVIAAIITRMKSAKILHDYDNYQDSLSDYEYVKYLEGRGKAGAADKVKELKQFFNRTNPNNKPSDETK